jgi:hypothetical protein
MFMPASWAWGQLNDGRWWCGDRDDRFLCELHHEIAPPRPVSGDDEATPLANARYRLDALRRFLEQQGTLGDIVQSKALSGGILHAIIDEEEESGTYRAAKWFAVTGYSRGVSIFRINLTAAVEHWNAPIRSELIDLFSEQAEFGTGYTAPSNLGLRDIRLAPATIFSVPANWFACREEHKVLISGPDHVPSLIAETEFVDPEELRAMSIDGSFPHVPRAEYVLHVAERFVRTLAVSTVLRPVEVTLYGALVTTELPGNPNPDETGTIWYYLIPRPEGCVIITFTLDTQSAMRDRPEFAEAKALLARQIANLRLELEDARDE